MTEPLYRADPYRREAPGTVVAVTAEGGLVLDESLFYPRGGGQPGDSGWLDWDGGRVRIADTVKAGAAGIALMPEAGAPGPVPGTAVVQRLDWPRRLSHMRVHTALHLLSVVLPFPVTGGAVSEGRGRLDFAMAEPIEDRAALAASLQALVDRDLPVTEDWITEAALDADPGLVKTMSVAPPRGEGRVRLIRIGTGPAQVDVQPCGGTHVARTGEIGRVEIGKVEKKGAMNRRVGIVLAD